MIGALLGACQKLSDRGCDPATFIFGNLKSTIETVGFFEGGGIARAKSQVRFGICHSFVPGTDVLMADGSKKNIEDIEVGDTVLATDPESGKDYEKKVLETIRTEDDKDFTELTVATTDGPASIVSTDTHPFWVPELKKWVNAADLQVGLTLHTSTGNQVQITALNQYTKRQRTHDLTINDVHTYYVLAGATPVLVHNCGTTPPGVQCNCAPGTGAGPADAPIRNSGAWTRSDIIRGSLGLRPNQLGDRIEIHHADQMPGAPIHELDQNVHRGVGTDLHRNPHNQGVTKEMRKEDTQLHWWYRSQEQGWGTYSPDHWFDNWPG
ncbi:polymorphic toxin-type HINT domain-containing protein [Streptomyces sp. NBC_01264]|uniref:polymorphic toxin-type HINT domain-containing protein n=1 Tax=Streptomyces sp. NBC_01264 TaxID=2903804 RepID=UPI00225B5C22|nr:polymorphic toxin-type HINT domain-containing protein [Streptomyces sp. NBC_01264]MCX4784264.1 polymorphic toxin-type HINT domain-containing protein [Streptomyces sp. NBC_01264]